MVGVLLLAALLRMGWPGVNSFSFDEARVSLMALKMARQGELARVGMQSSAGPPNFPGAVWIYALPYWASSDPLVANLFVGLLGALAVGGVWWMARQAWGPWAAFAASLLFAGSPFAVFYSRSIWGQDLLPPLAVAWAAAGLVSGRQGKWWAVALHVFLGGFAFQVHYAGIALLAATVWMVWRTRLWRRWSAILAGGSLAALCASPYVYTAWCCAPSIWEAFGRLWRQPATTDLLAFRHLLRMGAGVGWERLLLGDRWSWAQPFSLALNAASLLTAALVVLGVVALAYRARGEKGSARRTSSGVLLALVVPWALSAPLVFLRHAGPVYPQYQLTALPAAFLVGGAAARLSRRVWWGPTVAAMTLVVAATQASAMGYGLSVVARRLTPGGIGTPLIWPAAAARALQDGRPVVAHAHGDRPEFFGDVAGFSVLFWDYPHRIVDGRSVLLIPRQEERESGAHLMATFPDLPAWVEARASGLRGEVRSFPRREGEPPYLALTLAEADPAGFQPTHPLDLASGARLRGWRVRRVGDRMRFITWWEIAAPPGPGEYHQFNHLRSADLGEPLAIHDVPLSSQAWQVGDTLLAWADFDRPGDACPLWMDVGMYTWPEIERTAVLNRSGDPLAPIRLGPFEWPGDEAKSSPLSPGGAR